MKLYLNFVLTTNQSLLIWLVNLRIEFSRLVRQLHNAATKNSVTYSVKDLLSKVGIIKGPLACNNAIPLAIVKAPVILAINVAF